MEQVQKVEFVPFLLTKAVDIYAIRFGGSADTELKKFMLLFKDSEDVYLKDDYDRIRAAIVKIAENGDLESYFRLEGHQDDRVAAIPLLIKPRNHSRNGTLRLYCIRISDQLLIVGGGGLKTTRTYEDDNYLSQQVATLQSIDAVLKELESDGKRLEDELPNIIIEVE